MRKVLTWIALAMLVALKGAEPASAETRCNPFWKNMGSPKEFASVVENSLARDPKGVTLMGPVRCDTKGDRSCGTASAVLKAIKSENPRATVHSKPLEEVGQLPDYLRKLVGIPAPPGRYRLWGTIPSEDEPSGWGPIPNCVTREFGGDELVYYDPDTQVSLFAQDCANVINGPEIESCVDIVFPTDDGDSIWLGQWGPEDLTRDPCTSLLRAGETEFEWPYIERCKDASCSMEGVNRKLGKRPHGTGSFVAKKGHNVLRLSAKVALDDSDHQAALCRRTKTGQQTCATIVRWPDFIKRSQADRRMWRVPAGDSLVAEIRWDRNSAEKLMTRADRKSDLYWNVNLAECR